MTTTYDKFLEQFHAQGRQKADGYDKSHFDGLTTDEMEKAFELLTGECLAPGVFEWLNLLDRQRAIALAKQQIQLHPAGKSGIQRAYSYLHFIEKGNSDIFNLMHIYPNLPNRDRDETLWIIEKSNIPQTKKSVFFEQTLETETDIDVATTAADFFLVENAIPRSTPVERKKFYELRSKLINAIPSDKKIIISTIKTS